MIRHRPAGSGHPYSVDTEQRDPFVPVAGEPLRLGVRTSSGVHSVELTVERWSDASGSGDRVTGVVRCEPVDRTSRGQTIDGGHLASAQARLARSAGGWVAVIDDLLPGERLRYRFTGATETGVERTAWFESVVASWSTAPDATVGVAGAPGIDRLVPGSVRVLSGDGRIVRVRFALRLAAEERVTGFGERFDALQHRGERLDSMVFEQYKNQGAERKTYLPMPFAHVVGGEGWGFHVQTSRRVWFDVGAGDPDLLVVEAETDVDEGAVAVTTALYAGDPRAVLDAFLDEVGRPAELPDWVFRLWASGNEWNTQHEVLRQAELHREHDIPVGSIVIEAWSDESTFTVFRDARYTNSHDGSPLALDAFEFPAEGAWPDPKGMVDDLHARGIRVHLWQIPLIKMRPHPVGQVRADADAAVRENVLIREQAPDGSLRPYRNRGWWFPLGLMPDLTDERAARWWTEKRRYLVDEVGIDGFKTDGGEHAWGRDLVYLDGTRGDEGNNRFPVAYAKAYGDLLERSGKAPVTFSRAGFTGSQAHGAFWAGDENSTWDAYRWSLLAGLSAAASGIVYWGWDIAGFSGDVPDAELYLRATAASVFVPIMQYHSEFNHHRSPSRDRTPWNIAEQSGSAEVLPVFREFARLRERLVPYLAEAAAQSIRTGAPLMRPLYFEHPHDERVWEHPFQWLLGDDLLVSPVVEAGEAAHAVYLPAGEWVDVWTGEQVTGEAVVRRITPLSEVPVYARAAAWPALRPIFASR
jgi:alpha-glucosidase (family GH31 glycosyl hydrolase)